MMQQMRPRSVPFPVSDSDAEFIADARGAAAVQTATMSVQTTADRRAAALRGAVLAIYDAHHRELATFVRAIERDRDTADDIVSETFTRLIAEMRQGRTPEQPRAWLHRVAANIVVDGGRRRQVFGRIIDRLVDRRHVAPADEPILQGEFRREIRDALALLPVDARTALMLAAHGFSGREVADAIGRTESATRTLMCRARITLRAHLDGTEARP